MENYESFNISLESIINLMFESIRQVRDKKELTYQQSLYIYN